MLQCRVTVRNQLISRTCAAAEKEEQKRKRKKNDACPDSIQFIP